MKKIPVVMCIDVEPDERLTDPSVRSDWSGFERTFEFFSKLRPCLETKTGAPVHFSWFIRMDPQIQTTYGSASWAVTRYRSVIERIKRAGDATGLHTHAWRWNEGLNNRYLSFVVRSDVSIHPDLRSHLDQTFSYILSHPLIGHLVFETPAEMIRRVR